MSESVFTNIIMNIMCPGITKLLLYYVGMQLRAIPMVSAHKSPMNMENLEQWFH